MQYQLFVKSKLSVEKNLIHFYEIFKGANRYQKVVGLNGVGKGISGLLPRMYFWKVIFALIFGAGQKKC